MTLTLHIGFQMTDSKTWHSLSSSNVGRYLWDQYASDLWLYRVVHYYYCNCILKNAWSRSHTVYSRSGRWAQTILKLLAVGFHHMTVSACNPLILKIGIYFENIWQTMNEKYVVLLNFRICSMPMRLILLKNKMQSTEIIFYR